MRDEDEREAFGTINNPHTVAPNDWDIAGVEYGAYCRCAVCGIVERSTFSFDYYADSAGDPLVCETCKTNRPHESVKPLIEKLERDGEFERTERG